MCKFFGAIPERRYNLKLYFQNVKKLILNTYVSSLEVVPDKKTKTSKKKYAKYFSGKSELIIVPSFVVYTLQYFFLLSLQCRHNRIFLHAEWLFGVVGGAHTQIIIWRASPETHLFIFLNRFFPFLTLFPTIPFLEKCWEMEKIKNKKFLRNGKLNYSLSLSLLGCCN